MAQLDWKRLLSLSPEDLSDEEKDDLYDTVIWFKPESNTDAKKMTLLFRFVQEILKYKGEQVESLVLELDDLAAQQGREEAQRHQELIEEIEELRSQLSQAEAVGKHITKSSEADDLKQELVRRELQNEELITELKTKEREIIAEKREVEKLAGQVTLLQQEKAELKREIAALHEETLEHRSMSRQESPDLNLEKQQELINTIREKNKHISDLLRDVETIEKENLMLREKVSTLRDELSDATKHLTELTGETASLKHTCQEREEKLSFLDEQNAALRNQVQEMVQQKMLRDSQLDDFSEALDSRVQKWKEVLEKKDAEIEELQARLSHLAAQAPNIQIDTERSRVALLTQTLQKQEDQIENLQKQLTQATKELNDSAAIIEQFKAQKSKRNMTAVVEATTVQRLRTQLQQADERIKLLEEKLKDAEEDAQLKAEEATEMIVQLREYESGEYGLAEAVSEIKELRQQCRVRDKHIEELVQASNKLEGDASQLEEQNMALREKLGLQPEEPVCVDGVLAQRKKDHQLMRVLQQQAERLEEEKVQLKLDNRKLIQQLNTVQSKSAQDMEQSDGGDRSLVLVNGECPYPRELELMKKLSVESPQFQALGQQESEQQRLMKQAVVLQEKLEEVINENEALRKGLHEILDSIHTQDGTSTVQLESRSLERLLEALDSRHISGWYHPAMRLQAQLHSLEGSNAVLREQLRATRLEETKSAQELYKAELKIVQLEQSLAALQEGQSVEKKAVFEEMILPSNMSYSSTEIVAKLNMHLLHVLNEHHNQEEKNKVLEKKIEEYCKRFNVVRHQMGLLYRQYGADKSEWKKVQENLNMEREGLEDSIASLEAQVSEYNKQMDALNRGEEAQAQLAANILQLAELQASKVLTSRKCKALQNIENFLRRENEKIKEEMNAMECAVTQRIGDLQRQKEMSAYQITSLQRRLEESVPVAALNAANRQINELTAKYRDLLQKEHNSECESLLIARLEGEITVLCKNKEHLHSELLIALEKVHSLEMLVASSNQDTVTQEAHDNQISLLAKKLANAEVKEIYQTQRAEHADKMYEIVKGQLSQLEGRLSELEANNSTLHQDVLKLQEVERELRDSLVSSVNHSQLQQLEVQKIALQLEKERLQEVGDIAQEQVRSLELWKQSQDYELKSLRGLVLELQATGDEKVSIARLSHEVLTIRLSEAACQKKVQQLQNELTKMQAHSLRQECKVDEKERVLRQLRSQMNARCSNLHQYIQNLRQQYSGALPLASQERIALSMNRLVEERRLFTVKLCELQMAGHEAASKRAELELEMKSLKELKTALERNESQTQGQKQLVEWHNRNTELRLKELKARRRAEFLESQYQQSEERLQRQEEHIATLEEERVNLEKDWEQAQLSWEHMQVELYKQLSGCETQQKVDAAIIEQQSTVVEKMQDDGNVSEQLKKALCLVNKQSQNLLKCEGELAQLKMKVKTLSQQVKEKEDLVQSRDKIIAELQVLVSKAKLTSVVQSTQLLTGEKEVVETSDKLALKSTVDSLQNILTQKEETIFRYQQLLKEGRDEHSRIASKLQEELLGLQAALSTQHQAYCRLKNRNRQQLSSESRNVPEIIEKYLNQLQEREDEVSELQTTVGNLSNQLQSVRQEMERWRVLAEDRLNNMGELRQRLEEQHRNELQRYRDEAQRFRVELETARQDLSLLQEELKQQMESSQKSPSAVLQSCVNMLRAQVEEKEAQRQMLANTVVELQNEVKQMANSAGRVAATCPELTVLDLAAISASQQSSIPKKQTSSKERVLASELKSARAEIQKLQDQLQQKSQQLVRRDLSENRVTAREAQLQKKVKALEEQLQEIKEKDDKESAEAVSVKVKSSEELARWDERKKWQQSVEKLQQKLKEKTAELEKIQRTITSHRDTIARLEREKNILSGRLKSGKGSAAIVNRIQTLEVEKCNLEVEVSSLKNKLELQQHHAGGLGAAMLQERLEAQQRRIAALELSKKVNPSVAAEVEKLQESNAILQKANLRMESENFTLRVDLEKFCSETPHLKEQIQHLESYVAMLKQDQERSDEASGGNGGGEGSEVKPKKTTAQLQKTIMVLKKVVTKLQIQNKQLQESKKEENMEKEGSEDKVQAELKALKMQKQNLQQHYVDVLQKTSQLQAQICTLKAEKSELEKRCEKVSQNSTALEAEFKLAKSRIRTLETSQESPSFDPNLNELNMLKIQVIRKSQLLGKVKTLLQEAAVREDSLNKQVALLQNLVPASVLKNMNLSKPPERENELESS